MRVVTWNGFTVILGFRSVETAVIDGFLRCVIRPRPTRGFA